MADREPDRRDLEHSVSVSWPVPVVLTAALAGLGGVTPGASWCIAMLVVGLFVGRLARGQAWDLGLLALVLAALGVWTGLQALPLPIELVRTLSPESARAFSELDSLLGRAGGFASLSLEPGATRLEALRLFTYAMFSVVCHQVAKRTGSRVLCGYVGGVGALLAVVSLLHQALAAERVFGWYQPAYAGFVAPLMNPNNLVGACNVAFFCTAGLALDPRSGERVRLLSALGCMLLSGCALWVGSRAGVVLLAVLLGVLCVQVFGRRKSVRDAARRPALVGLAVATLAGVVFAGFSAARLGRELLDDSTEKLEVIAPALLAANQYWALGAGKGAFGVAVAPFVKQGQGVFEHAESFPFAWLVEWGAPLGGSLLVLVVVWLWPRGLATLSLSRLGAYLGVCCIWLHNLVDLSLEVPYVALATIAATSAFGGFRARRVLPGYVKRPFGVGVPALAALLLASWSWAPVELARAARYRLAQQLSSGPMVTATLRAALTDHPADGYLLRLGAAEALARRDPLTLRWLGSALERAPMSGRTVLLLADALFLRGSTGQALGALRRAAELEPQLASEVSRRALAWAPDAVEAIVPVGDARLIVLLALSRQSENEMQRLGFALEAARHPGADEAVEVELLERALAAEDATCRAILGADCTEAVQGRRARWSETGSPRWLELDARVLSRKGYPDDAVGRLERGCPRSPAGHGCLRLWLSLGQHLALPRQLAAADALLATCASPDECARERATVAEALLRRGERGLALLHLREGARLDPSSSLLTRVAELAIETNDLAALLQALSELERLGKPPPEHLREAAETMRRQRL